MKRTAPLSRIFLVVLAAAMAVVPVAAFQVTPTAPRFEGKVIQDPSATLNSAPVPAKELKAGTMLVLTLSVEDRNTVIRIQPAPQRKNER